MRRHGKGARVLLREQGRLDQPVEKASLCSVDVGAAGDVVTSPRRDECDRSCPAALTQRISRIAKSRLQVDRCLGTAGELRAGSLHCYAHHNWTMLRQSTPHAACVQDSAI